jgi:hypothetical protein
MNSSQKLELLIANVAQQYFLGQINAQMGKRMNIEQRIRQQPAEQKQLLRSLGIRTVDIDMLTAACWLSLGLLTCSLLGGIQ